MSQKHWAIIVDTVEELRRLQTLIAHCGEKYSTAQAMWLPQIHYKLGWHSFNCAVVSTMGSSGVDEDVTAIGIHFDDCIAWRSAKGIDQIPYVSEECFVVAVQEAEQRTAEKTLNDTVAQEQSDTMVLPKPTVHSPQKTLITCKCGHKMLAQDDCLCCFECGCCCDLIVDQRCDCDSTLHAHLTAEQNAVTLRCCACRIKFVPRRTTLTSNRLILDHIRKTRDKSIAKRRPHKKLASLVGMYAK